MMKLIFNFKSFRVFLMLMAIMFMITFRLQGGFIGDYVGCIGEVFKSKCK